LTKLDEIPVKKSGKRRKITVTIHTAETSAAGRSANEISTIEKIKPKTKAGRKHYDTPAPTCSTPKPKMSGIPESMTNWAIARQGGGISVESSADFLRESCDVENLVENLIEKPAAGGGAGEVDPLEDVNADSEARNFCRQRCYQNHGQRHHS
jgi:hypothetical protein